MPASLHKKESETVSMKLERFVLAHANIIFPLLILLLLILFVCLCYAICGVSATDSGVKYNHLKDVV